MKTIIKKISLVCIVVFTAISCTKDQIDTFSGKNDIFFQWSIEGRNRSFIDSTAFTFVYTQPGTTDSTYNIPVRALGNLVNKDRDFKVRVLPESDAKEGVHFTLPEKLIVPADSIRGFVPVKLLRTPDMEDNTFSIKLALEPNENFGVNYYGEVFKNSITGDPIKHNEFTLTVSDIIIRPRFWDDITTPAFLGPWSVKKFKLYHEVNGIPIENWNEPGVFDFSKMIGRGTVLKVYLNQQRLNGTPVLEDDGTEMVLGPNI